MSVTVTWHIPDKVIRVELVGMIGDGDVPKGERAIVRHLDEATSSPVHILYDMTRAEKLGFSASQAQAMSTYFRNPKLGWLVVFGAKGTVRVIAEVFSRAMGMIFPLRVRFVDTQDEAMAWLRQQDAALERNL